MSQFLVIAEQLLAAEGRPMTPKELVDLAYKKSLFSDKWSGKTPHQTMKAKLSVHVRKLGSDSTFVRTAPGRFFLRRLLTTETSIYEAKPALPPKPVEHVLSFPSVWLDQHDRFQGIRKTWKHTNALFEGSQWTYIPRLKAETIDDHKQVLNYVLVTHRGRVLAYRRGTFSRVETYLRGSHCIGFGGHVTETDQSLFSKMKGVREAAIRELLEELKLPDTEQARLQDGEGLHFIGLLNDDSSDVGRRHFAVLFRYELSSTSTWDKPERGEKAITQLRWLDPSGPDSSMSDFEYWSQLCLRTHFPQMVRVQAKHRILRRRPLQPPHLLCVIGGVGSGKTEATRVLKERFGYKEINSGVVVAELLGIDPVPETPRKIFQEKAWRFISSTSGPRKLAEAIWRRVQAQNSHKVLVDGIRQHKTLEFLRGYASAMKVGTVFVQTPPDLAFEFYKCRETKQLSIHDFLQLRSAPVETEVEDMIGKADAILYNWTGKVTFRKAVDQMMHELKE